MSKGVQRDKYIDKYIALVTIGRGRCTTRRNVCQSAQADVDPTISLAFTLDAHPGSYALLPGAGRPISSAPRIGSQKVWGPISAYDDSQVPQKLLTTVLQSLADGREWRARDFYQHVIDGLDFPEQERTEKCGRGGSSDRDPAVDQRSLAVPSGAGAISRHFFVGAAATSQCGSSVDREVTSAQWRVS